VEAEHRDPGTLRRADHGDVFRRHTILRQLPDLAGQFLRVRVDIATSISFFADDNKPLSLRRF
jgi:hypothetical protein